MLCHLMCIIYKIKELFHPSYQSIVCFGRLPFRSIYINKTKVDWIDLTFKSQILIFIYNSHLGCFPCFILVYIFSSLYQLIFCILYLIVVYLLKHSNYSSFTFYAASDNPTTGIWLTNWPRIRLYTYSFSYRDIYTKYF